MIFFVDHDTERLTPIHHYGAAGALRGMFTTDQMALDEHLLVQCREALQAFRKRILHLRKFFHPQPTLFEDGHAFGFLRPPRKTSVTKIPRATKQAGTSDW